jgi:hypothetical protein
MSTAVDQDERPDIAQRAKVREGRRRQVRRLCVRLVRDARAKRGNFVEEVADIGEAAIVERLGRENGRRRRRLKSVAGDAGRSSSPDPASPEGAAAASGVAVSCASAGSAKDKVAPTATDASNQERRFIFLSP